MAGDKDQPEEVVADRAVESGCGVRRGLLEGFEFTRELSVFAPGDGVPAEEIDSTAPGDCSQPCGGIRGDSGIRPLLEGGDQRLLSKVFG